MRACGKLANVCSSFSADVIRRAIGAASGIRHASMASAPVKKKSAGRGLGRQIFAFFNLQTNQVIYSLTRAVKNNHALRQLPYNGKKTVPAGLRKDLWHPFARIEFPANASAAGLKTFQQLREYRTLHELSWPSELCLDEDGKKLSRRERGRKLCDQKANSVADMAAALKNVTMREVAEKSKGDDVIEKVLEPVVTAKIMWMDIFDAEYAESWPETVVHDKWETKRNNRAPKVKKGIEARPPPELQKDELGRVIL